MDLPTQFNRFIPFDYLNINEKEDIASEFLDDCMSHNKKDKAKIKYYTSFRANIEKKQFEKILITNEDEQNILNDLIIKFFSESNIEINLQGIENNKYNLLSFDKYPFLYLLDRNIPFVSAPMTFHELFDLKNPQDFIDFCYDSVVFGEKTTKGTIDEYFYNVNNYLEKFIYCLEEYLNINIVCLSNLWQYQEQSKILVSVSVPERRYLPERPTIIIFRDVDNWYNVEYLDLDTKKSITYDKLGNPHSLRLGRLIDIETEKVDKNKLVVYYEPTDIGRELPKIELVIGDKTHQFLVGSTYNLYLPGNPGQSSILVGKIDIIDVNSDAGIGRANIKWVEGYPDNLV